MAKRFTMFAEPTHVGALKRLRVHDPPALGEIAGYVTDSSMLPPMEHARFDALVASAPGQPAALTHLLESAVVLRNVVT